MNWHKIINLTSIGFVISNFGVLPNITKNHNIEESVINLENKTNVSEILDEINQNYNIFMPKSAEKLVEVIGKNKTKKIISENSFNNLVNYINQINFDNHNLTFKFKNFKFNYDFSSIKTIIEKIKSKLNFGYKNTMDVSYKDKQVVRALFRKMPNMSAIIADLLGRNFGLKMTGYMAIPENGYEDFVEMLNLYHNFSYKLVNSDVFKEWSKGLKDKNIYKLIKDTGFLKSNYKIFEVKQGEHYDKKSKHKFPAFVNPNLPEELNNFEAQLVLSITNLYSLY